MGLFDSKLTTKWRLESLMTFMGSLASSLPGLVPSHVKRTTNKVVDLLANVGLNNHMDVQWENLPNLPWKQYYLSLVEVDTLDDIWHLLALSFILSSLQMISITSLLVTSRWFCMQ
jgi:hypothetical protein